MSTPHAKRAPVPPVDALKDNTTAHRTIITGINSLTDDEADT
jgi:hypothetical protein